MSLKQLTVGAVAAFALALSSYAATAGSITEPGISGSGQPAIVNSKSTFTLIRGGRGGGHGGGHGGHGGGRGGVHARGGGHRGFARGLRGHRFAHVRASRGRGGTRGARFNSGYYAARRS